MSSSDKKKGVKADLPEVHEKSAKPVSRASKSKLGDEKTAQKKKPAARAAPKKASKDADTKKPKSAKNSKAAPKKRHFKRIDPSTGSLHGRYSGTSPEQAAGKGASKYMKSLEESGKSPKNEFTIYMKESTRDSKGGLYGYKITRSELSEPREVKKKIAGSDEEKVVTYKFTKQIRRIPVPPKVAELVGATRAAPKKAKKAASEPKTRAKKSKSSGK